MGSVGAQKSEPWSRPPGGQPGGVGASTGPWSTTDERCDTGHVPQPQIPEDYLLSFPCYSQCYRHIHFHVESMSLIFSPLVSEVSGNQTADQVNL